MRPFPEASVAQWQVSTDGGQEPVWAHSGRELFYVGSGSLWSVEVLPGATFIRGQHRGLFSTSVFETFPVHRSYDVAADDQRFVMVRDLEDNDAGEIIVIENFFEELKAKVGN